ncbi:MAG TPA: hypothetical protein VK395_28345 [Gemmataceae bacterium]|nr:hypothetical protein [Gemmataceae bacterium]
MPSSDLRKLLGAKATEILLTLIDSGQPLPQGLYESAENCDFAVYVYAGPRGQAQPTPDKPAGALACPPEGPGETLSPIERDILEALRNSTLTARTLANKAGYRFNSYFRAILSGLVRRGYLVVTTQGYCRAPSVQDGS